MLVRPPCLLPLLHAHQRAEPSHELNELRVGWACVTKAYTALLLVVFSG